ncbi:MAG: hypothetical protein HY881_11720 [Deltaproteobacteria bacterium]|nr:hypothetical protein [Deltaproteobacteria bacterium]
MRTWAKIWLFVLMYLSAAGAASADNPTYYTSLYPSGLINGDYGRAAGADGHGNVIVNNAYISGFKERFRVFIPPGSTLISLEILEWGGVSAIAHHETPPTSAFGQFSPSSSYTLASLEASDQYYAGQINGGRLAILSDGFAAPYLSAARGGWLYVKVDSDKGSYTYYNSVNIVVNADAYNNWYNHSGSNPDGSINWATDVEGVTEYLEPSARPGKPEVTPANNTIWTSGITQTITATSTKAANIYGTFTSSSDVNNPPADPRIPSANDFDISGSGTSLSDDLIGVAGEIRIYKYRFIGVNSGGSSDESGIYSYTIDLRPVTPGAVTATPSATFKTTPANITVTSANATTIYYTLTNGLNPSDPPDPIGTGGVSNVAGPSSVVSLAGTPGQITTYKLKFMGYNANGTGSSGSISAVYTYVMDLTPPEAVSATPSSGSWTSAQAPVSLTCSGAEKIYYSISTSISGTPADPDVPTINSSVITLTNGSGTFNIPYGNNADMRTSVRFIGWNGGGFSPSSLLCSYEINNYTPPPVGDPPGPTSASPASGSWTDASQAFTSVSSQGATSIFATYTKTTDGSTPGTPPDPNSSALLSGGGSTVRFTIPVTAQKLNKVLMKFVGVNDYGVGTVSATCSYTIDLSGQTPAQTPGAVSANPTNGSWTSAGQTIAVSSANASQVEYAYNKTTDGTDPADPTDPSVPSTPSNPFVPSPTTNEIRGIISGAVGNYVVPSSTGTITKIKIKFCGKNSAGYGADTQTYSYTIDLKSPVQLPGAVVVSPGDTSWTTAPQTISVSSTNAKQINYTYTETEDDSEPSEPTDPSAGSQVAGIGSITGASGNFAVPYSTKKNTRIKIRFCGKNDAGYGTATSTYSYAIDMRLPAEVVVSPGDTSWTTAPQTISVSSTNAKQINYNYTKTEDGSEPATPTDPSTANVLSGQISASIAGSSGNFTVPSSTNKNTRIKIRFCGKNDSGHGPTTTTYSYGINLIRPYQYGDTLSSSDAKAVPGLNITPIITTTVNGQSVLDPNAKFLQIDATHAYSVVDLITEYLKGALGDSSIHMDTSADGVMTIGSQNFGGIVFTVITGSLVTTDASYYFKSTDTGNIEICTRNIIITLYPAGADQAIFKQTIESYAGWTVSYGADHVVLVNAPNYPMAFRFQLYADKSKLTATGSSQCLFTGNNNSYGTVVVTYPDGTKQNLIPYVHDPEGFASLLEIGYSLTCVIDSNTGKILIKNGDSIIWEGMPEYKLNAPDQSVVNSEIQSVAQNLNLNLLFLTAQGSQVLFETQ